MNIQTLFAQLQAIFTTGRMISQKMKFAYAVEKVPMNVAREILDLLNAVTEENT